MKLILIFILIFIIMLIAYSYSQQYKDKFDFYSNLKSFLLQFKINISFKQEKIIEFLNKLTPKKQFKLFIDEYKNYLQTSDLKLDKITLLDKEETSQLEEIIKGIGSYDISTELTQLETFILVIDKKLAEAEQEKNKLCPMIIKLSLLFAIGLAIILI